MGKKYNQKKKFHEKKREKKKEVTVQIHSKSRVDEQWHLHSNCAMPFSCIDNKGILKPSKDANTIILIF